jgi:hypothetical protein
MEKLVLMDFPFFKRLGRRAPSNLRRSDRRRNCRWLIDRAQAADSQRAHIVHLSDVHKNVFVSPPDKGLGNDYRHLSKPH